MIRSKGRQACSHAALTRYQHRCSLAAKICGDFSQVPAGSISDGKNDNRVVFRDERDRAVLEFGTAERLSVNVANLLQLQGGFACDGECGTAAQYDQVARSKLCAESLRPIELGGRGETIGQTVESGLDSALVGPNGNQVEQGGERRDERLGCGHAKFRPRGHRQDDVASSRQGALGIVNNGGSQSAGSLCRGRGLNEILTAARL